jgi:hypothetical protein
LDDLDEIDARRGIPIMVEESDLPKLLVAYGEEAGGPDVV